ncbi:helix-turn-helix transcriptional regulator [Allocoleopsis sp.]|uniref:helix-turn-helix transcriptional regulator n=1 Tax=Allocoleopsis sp. TaxID=3088169 RepID=UPI002FCE781D
MHTSIPSPVLLTEERRKAFLKKVGINLKAARLRANFEKQTEAAQAIGCYHDRISRAEAGKDIRISDLFEYAIAYGCDIKRFFD